MEEALTTLAECPNVTLIATILGQKLPGVVAWDEPVRLSAVPFTVAKQIFLRTVGVSDLNATDYDDLIADLAGIPLALTLVAHRAQVEQNPARMRRLWADERLKIASRGKGDHRSVDL